MVNLNTAIEIDPSVSLGVDPGANCGLAIARHRQPGEAGRYRYVLAHHLTIKTPPEHNVAERVAEYRQALIAACTTFKPDAAYVEVPWHQSRKSNALSVYTRDGKNVGGIALLCAITGGVFAVLHQCGVPIYEVPAPTGKSAAKWEKQKEVECRGVYGVELKKHEAVAGMLALKGL